MIDTMSIFRDNYITEKQLIRSNGNNKKALEIRADQHHISEQELLEYITRRTIELAGRRAAWKDMYIELCRGD